MNAAPERIVLNNFKTNADSKKLSRRAKIRAAGSSINPKSKANHAKKRYDKRFFNIKSRVGKSAYLFSSAVITTGL
jgi:hypothetical protein